MWLWVLGGVLAVPGGLVGYLLWLRQRYVAYHHHKGLPLPLDGRDALWQTAEEVGALAWMGWQKVAALGRDGWMDAEGAVRGPPVLCVHGFLNDGTSMWRLRRVLARHGRPSVAVTMGVPPRDQDRYADRVEGALADLTSMCGGSVDVVCHSMGGIVLRRVLQRRPDLARAIDRIVTVATPHEGTAATRGLPVLPELRAMARGGDWLDALPTLDVLVPDAVVVTVGSPHDATVYPLQTTTVPGAHAVALPGLGHSGLLVRWRALAHIVAALER